MRKHFHSRQEPWQKSMVCGIWYLTPFGRTAQMLFCHEPCLHYSASAHCFTILHSLFLRIYLLQQLALVLLFKHVNHVGKFIVVQNVYCLSPHCVRHTVESLRNCTCDASQSVAVSAKRNRSPNCILKIS